MLNDKDRREYVFERYRYFLTRFPVYAPIIFSLFSGLFNYIKAYIRNRFFWIIGYLLVRRPHKGAIHIFEYKADINRQRAKLNRLGALKGQWPPAASSETCGSCETSCGTASCGTK